MVAAREVHPLIGNTTWGLPIRIFQFIFAVLVMSLSAYTLSVLTDWREVRFTVAAGAWAVLSLIWILTSGMIHRPTSHYILTLVLEFINWALFLAVWIALSVNVGQKTECALPDDSHSHSRECNTIYTAIAFAILDWILFTFTFVAVGIAVSAKKDVVSNEKTAGTGAPVRPSDDGTLSGDNAA